MRSGLGGGEATDKAKAKPEGRTTVNALEVVSAVSCSYRFASAIHARLRDRHVRQRQVEVKGGRLSIDGERHPMTFIAGLPFATRVSLSEPQSHGRVVDRCAGYLRLWYGAV